MRGGRTRDKQQTAGVQDPGGSPRHADPASTEPPVVPADRLGAANAEPERKPGKVGRRRNTAPRADPVRSPEAQWPTELPLATGTPGANPRNPRRVAGAALDLSASVEDATRPGPRLATRAVAARSTAARLLPPISEIRRFNTTRLLPAKYSESVLTRIADSNEDLALIFALESATNERLLAEQNLRIGITARELVFNIPHYRIINAAFTHPHPQGGRFSLPYRGAWYAGLDLATAKAEVLFHRMLQFAEIGWRQAEELDYDQYLGDFCGSFHDLRPEAFSGALTKAPSEPPDSTTRHPASEEDFSASEPRESGDRVAKISGSGEVVEDPNATPTPFPGEAPFGVAPTLEASYSAAADFADCMDPGSYVASQRLTLALMEAGSLGILYASTRRAAGQCIACFRPSLVCNVRKRDLYRLTWYPDRAATFLRQARPVPSA